MNENHMKTKAEKFFWRVTGYPIVIISAFVLLIAGIASQMPKMTINTAIESYIPKGHSSLLNRDKVREIFGLTDPIVVAVTNSGEKGAFTPGLLNLVTDLTGQIQQVEGVDPDQVTSLVTENNIYGTADGMVVEPFVVSLVTNQEEADGVRDAVMKFPLYVGNLVSEDGSTILIVAELLDKNKYGPAAYHAIKNMADDLIQNRLPAIAPRAHIHVAGEGGVVAHLADYIDQDAKKMTPMAFFLIVLVLIISYRTFRGLYLSVIVILGSVIGAMGLMAAFGVPMYQVSNVIPVTLIAISVADAIHILGQYYENLSKEPTLQSRELVARTMGEMWRPVTVTSITDVVGFLAMGFTATIPPMRMVGVFSSVGVVMALLISLFMIPSILVLLKPKSSKAYRKVLSHDTINPDVFGRLMIGLGKSVTRRPKVVISLAALSILVGILGISRMVVDEATVENFNSGTDIYKADRLINARMDGANTFDVMVSTGEKDGLFHPNRLKKIESLQRYIDHQPNVGGTTSIVDLLKQMNRSLNENRQEAYTIPESADLVAQYFLLYSASADPSDFEQYVDYDYQLANISVTIKEGHYSGVKPIIENVSQYIENEFNDREVRASVAGWMNVFYHWIGSVAYGHFSGVILALLLVWAVSAYSFRSGVAGLLAVLPVFTAVFIFYAVMGFSGIYLNSATAMFPAIAIGVAVDFSVHLIDRIIYTVKEQRKTLDKALEELFPSTGRALLFNVAAVSLGFGSNMISSIPPFITFGALITTCVATSFLGSVTLLPALIRVFKPKFLTKHIENHDVTEEQRSDPFNRVEISG